MRIGMFWRKKERQVTAQMVQTAKGENTLAQREAEIAGQVSNGISRLLGEENQDVKLVDALIRLSRQREGIEQSLANASNRAYRALGRFKSAAAVAQGIAQKARAIAQTGYNAARVGGANRAELGMVSAEADKLAQTVSIAEAEERVYRQGMAQFVLLTRNLARALEISHDLARRYANELREVPILEQEDLRLVQSLDNARQLAQVAERRAAQHAQMLRSA